MRWYISVLVLGLLLAESVVAGPLGKSPKSEGEALGFVPSEIVTEEGLRAHVDFLAGMQPPRNLENPESLHRVSEYIAAEFEAAGARVEFQEYSLFHDETYRNVRAFFGPKSKTRLVVGAHYDVAGNMPGADDNASAVAVLLFVARLLAEKPPEQEVELVAFTLEEPPVFRSGGMGSARHAALLRAEGVELRGMIALEMLGYYSDEPGSQTYPTPLLRPFYPNRADFLGVVGRPSDWGLLRRVTRALRMEGGVPIRKLAAPRALVGIDFSDHASYWEAGFSAVMLTDTAFFRNPNYHEPTDLPETLDYARLRSVAIQVHGAVLELSR